MRPLAPDEIDVLRRLCSGSAGDSTEFPDDDPMEAHERLVARGCVLRTDDDEWVYYEATDLGRLALRVAIHTPSMVA